MACIIVVVVLSYHAQCTCCFIRCYRCFFASRVDFEHISTLRAAAVRAATARSLRASRKESFVTVDLVGHLFDSGIINRILDLIEDKQVS